MKLVAHFAPNTDESSYPTSTREIDDEHIAVSVTAEGIVATGSCQVKGIMLYTIDAAMVAKTNGATLSTAGIKNGLYIASVITDKGYKNVKIYLNK